MVWVEIVGWVGTALLVVGYAIVSSRNGRPSLRYQILNGLGAAGLIVNGAVHGAWPSVGLNIVWLGIAITAIVRHLVDSRRAGRSSSAETAGPDEAA